jgi:hypothetical protein
MYDTIQTYWATNQNCAKNHSGKKFIIIKINIKFLLNDVAWLRNWEEREWKRCYGSFQMETLVEIF